MTDPILVDLSEISRLALASARDRDRPYFLAMLALDARLARIVAGTSEPMLGQLRLSWWREQLSTGQRIEHRSDPLLGLIDNSWPQGDHSLVELVDGWEAFLLSLESDQAGWSGVSDGRARSLKSVAASIGSTAEETSIEKASERWTFAEIGRRPAIPDDRPDPRARALRLDRAMRPLAVLDGLARRALLNGLPNLMAGRTFPLAAIRLGIFGR